MTTATATKPATKPATKAPKAPKAPKPTAAELELQAAELVKRWQAADKGEAKALDVFKAAGIAWENSRVIKVRVAWQAAMVKPNGKQTNLLNACRILFSDPDATPAERTKQAEAKKSTLRNYVDAGTALDAAGLDVYSVKEPTEEERKVVAAAFREGNKRAKDEANAANADNTAGDNTAGDTDAAGDDDEAVSYVHLVAHVAQLNKVLDMIQAGGVVISEREAGNMADMLNSFQMKLSAYADGK